MTVMAALRAAWRSGLIEVVLELVAGIALAILLFFAMQGALIR